MVSFSYAANDTSPTDPLPCAGHLLVTTAQQFTTVCNHVCAHGWTNRISNGVTLHHDTYYPTKSLAPDLVSDLVVQARVKATEALRSAFALQRQGRVVSQPHAYACPPRYNQHTYRLDWESRT